jgi:hypothetical protein
MGAEFAKHFFMCWYDYDDEQVINAETIHPFEIIIENPANDNQTTPINIELSNQTTTNQYISDYFTPKNIDANDVDEWDKYIVDKDFV